MPAWCHQACTCRTLHAHRHCSCPFHQAKTEPRASIWGIWDPRPPAAAGRAALLEQPQQHKAEVAHMHAPTPKVGDTQTHPPEMSHLAMHNHIHTDPIGFDQHPRASPIPAVVLGKPAWETRDTPVRARQGQRKLQGHRGDRAITCSCSLGKPKPLWGRGGGRSSGGYTRRRAGPGCSSR